MGERLEEVRQPYPYDHLRGSIEGLDLEAAEELPRLIHLAWAAQQH